MNFRSFIIDISGQPTRIDYALLKKWQETEPTLSRAFLKTLFHDNRIFWRGTPAKPSLLLPVGIHEVLFAEVDLTPQLHPKAVPSPSDFVLPIVYEDENLLILHKFSGTPSAPLKMEETRTAVNFALKHLPELAEIGRGGLEPGLLHRLDTGTSGLLVFAKTQNEFERLSIAWKNRQVQKYYRALTQSPTPLPQIPLRFDIPLAHDAHTQKKMIALSASNPRAFRGKPLPAVTHLLSVRKVNETQADFEIQIETGVMHQIRCHLATLGWPILGDPIYKGHPSHRLWLHAWKLKIPLQSGAFLCLEAQLPEGWPAF